MIKIENKKNEPRHDGLNISEEMYTRLKNEHENLEKEIKIRLNLHKKCKILVWRLVEVVFLIVVAYLLIFYPVFPNPVFPNYFSKFVFGFIFIFFGIITFRITKKLLCTSLKLLEDCITIDDNKLCSDIDELCEHLKIDHKKCKKEDTGKKDTIKNCNEDDKVCTVISKKSPKNIVIFFAEILVFFLIVFIVDYLYINSGLISPHPNVPYLIDPVYIILVILAGSFGIFLIEIFWRNLIVKKLDEKVAAINTPDGKSLFYVDWIIDKYSCKTNEKVVITITNLGNVDIIVNKNEKLCEVYEEGHEGEDGHYSKKLPEEEINITIPKDGNCSLFWDTKNVIKEGIYRIKPIGWENPLRRSVFVHMQLSDEDLKNIEDLFEQFKDEFENDSQLKEKLKADYDKIQIQLDEAKKSKDKKSISELHNAVSSCLKDICDSNSDIKIYFQAMKKGLDLMESINKLL